jgi:hypothetical protein
VAPLRIGLAGYGFGGRYFHAPFLATAAECEFLGVITTSAQRRDEFAEQFPGRATFDSLEHLAAAGTEAVTISTPARTHVELTQQALALGLAVVCDKPFALDAASARQTVLLSEQLQRPLTVFHNRRWDSDFLTVRQALADGLLADPVRFESRFEPFAPDPGPSASGGGTLLDFGSHLVDQALVLFGPARSVYAEMHTLDDAAGLDDDVFLAVTHASVGVRPQHGGRLHDDRALVARVGGCAEGCDREPQGGMMADERSSGTEVLSELKEPPLSIEQAEDPTAAPESDLEITAAAPEVLADSLGEYLRAWGRRIRSGESGALPILAGLIVIIIFFQIERSRFDSAINLVNLLQQAAIYILLGVAEIFALVLSEIDLSVGFVLAVGGFVIAETIASPVNFPWWLGILCGVGVTAAIGYLQGSLITRLHIPSFVVTLAGLLFWEGVMIELATIDKSAVGGVISVSNSSAVYKLVNDNISVGVSWIALAVVLAIFRGPNAFSRGAPASARAQYAAAQHHLAHDHGHRDRWDRCRLHL